MSAANDMVWWVLNLGNNVVGVIEGDAALGVGLEVLNPLDQGGFARPLSKFMALDCAKSWDWCFERLLVGIDALNYWEANGYA
jgi:hypothetical protein